MVDVEVDVKTVLKELQNYEVSFWDIKELLYKAVKYDIRKTNGLYLEDKEIVESYNISDSVKKTVESIVKRYDTIDNAVLHHAWEDMKGIRIESEYSLKETKFYVWEHRLSNFIYMLRYSINGKFDDNYSATNEFMDANKIKYDTNQGTFNLLGVTFRIFKNGKVSVKGLTNEQFVRIKAGYDNYKKYESRW